MLAKERITKVVEKWYLLEPLFFAVWTLHKVEPSMHLKTIKVHDGHIEYNPIFIDNLSTKDLEEVLSFEAMRIILKHPYRRKKDIAQIAYLASNITVQEYLKTTNLGFLSAEDFFKTKEFDKKHFELYYYKIIEIAENANSTKDDSAENANDQSGKNSDDDSAENSNGNSAENANGDSAENANGDSAENANGDSAENANGDSAENADNEKAESQEDGNSGNDANPNVSKENEKDKSSQGELDNNEQQEPQNNLDEYSDEKKSGYENAGDWDKSEYQEQLINDKIKEVQLSNSWGSITGDIEEKILATLKPKVNYKTILKSFRASVLSNTRRLTRMKPSRRYGFLYMGSRRDFTTKILFAVDISGSVDSNALKKAFSILNRFFKYGIEEISVICFDTEIKGTLLTLKKAKKEITIYGRGGTDFNAVTEYIDKNKSYDGVIIFTDGYASCPRPPKNRKTKILWLFDNERNYNDCKDRLSKLGKIAFVKEN